MRIGVPKEIKDREHRVALTPEGTRQLVSRGHEVFVESHAGDGSGFSDEAYRSVGAQIVPVQAAWGTELVLKVKEPLESEYAYLRHQILFTYLHLSGVSPILTDTLLAAGTTAIAYETVEDQQGRLPLLMPMSAVAGTMAIQVGGHYLAHVHGGKGTLLGNVLGKRNGTVLVIGDGVVGRHAARAALGLGAHVHLAGLFEERIPDITREVGSEVNFLRSTPETVAKNARHADVIVGAVLLPGAKAPAVISGSMEQSMEPGSVIVDVSIDQVSATDFDGIVIPGGYAPDIMRRYPKMVQLVKDLFERGKVVAAICHAGWMLASAKILAGKTVTSFFAIKDDLVHAGAEWIDQEVVVDGSLITSRTPDDLPAFMRTVIAALK
jgi:alanine dehydrogenase